MTREHRQRRRVEVPALAVSKRFGMYNKEEPQAVRKAQDIKKSEIREQLEKALEKLEYSNVSLANQDKEERNYTNALKAIEGLSITAKDVESFTVGVLPLVFQRWDFGYKAGFLLSALINTCKELDFTIHTQHIDTLLKYLGHQNCKNVSVNGNVGGMLGCEMRQGSITVMGDVAELVGTMMSGGCIIVEGDAGGLVGVYMKKGVIIIKGNAGHGLGELMAGGIIVVEGNADYNVGHNICGGEIHVEGEIGSIGNVIHGKIYHKGKLIVDK